MTSRLAGGIDTGLGEYDQRIVEFFDDALRNVT